MPAFLLTALPYLKRYWYAVPIAVLAVLLLIARGDARHWHKVSDQKDQAVQMANAKLAISNASIGNLTKALNEKDAESEQRAQAYTDAKAADEASRKENARLAASNDAARATLRAIAAEAGKDGTNGACKAPSGLVGALQGL